MPSLPRNPPISTPLGREKVCSSLQHSASVRRRPEVTITHTPTTPDARRTHAQSVEKVYCQSSTPTLVDSQSSMTYITVSRGWCDGANCLAYSPTVVGSLSFASGPLPRRQ